MKEYLIIAIYDGGYEFDVYASDKKISKSKKLEIKKHYDNLPFSRTWNIPFTSYLKRYYGKRYRIIIAEDGYIEEV